MAPSLSQKKKSDVITSPKHIIQHFDASTYPVGRFFFNLLSWSSDVK